MASYRQRGKNKLWDYRIFDKTGKVVATNSGFKTKREAMNEAQERERKLFQSNYTARFDSKATLYDLWQEGRVLFKRQRDREAVFRYTSYEP